MQSFIFLCKPCICPTESSQVKQLNPLCHSAHLFWDQSWPAGSAAVGIPSLAWVPLAVQPAVPGMDQQLLQATLRRLPPSCAKFLLVLSQLGPHHGQSDTDGGEQKDHSVRLLSPNISSFLWSVPFHSWNLLPFQPCCQ